MWTHLKPHARADNQLPSDDDVCALLAPVCSNADKVHAALVQVSAEFDQSCVFFLFFFLIICWDIDWGNYCCFIKVTPEPQRRSHHRPKPVKPLKWAPSLVILYFHVCSMVLSRHSHRRSENKILFCMQWCKRFERKTRVTSFLSTWWLCQTPAGVWGPAEHLEDTKLSSDVSFYISCWYSCLIISQCSWNITAKIYKLKFIKKI